MSGALLIGGAVIVTLGLIADAKGTVTLVTAVITIKGISFIAEKVIGSMNKSQSDIIRMASWCTAGIPIIGIIKFAIRGIQPLTDTINKTADKWTQIYGVFDSFAKFIEKIVPVK